MADEKPKTVTVEALQRHTYNGKDHAVGDTYELDESLVASVQAQGKAVPVDRVARAKAAVEPMTLRDKAVRPSRAGKKSRR